MACHDRIEGSAMLAKCIRCSRFVFAHEPAVASDIGGKDRSKSAFNALLNHGTSPRRARAALYHEKGDRYGNRHPCLLAKPGRSGRDRGRRVMEVMQPAIRRQKRSTISQAFAV